MRQANQIDLLHGLVAIPSLSGQEENAVGYLVGQMRARGFEASVDRVGNAVVVKGSGPTKIVLLGHIDTVPGDIPVRVEDGVLHGRGSCDAKGPLATFVAAAEQATGDNATIIVVGAVGEESIGSPGAHEAATWPAPDLCFIGEPSSWDAVCLGYRAPFPLPIVRPRPDAIRPDRVKRSGNEAFLFWNTLLAEIQQINGDARDSTRRLVIALDEHLDEACTTRSRCRSACGCRRAYRRVAFWICSSRSRRRRNRAARGRRGIRPTSAIR